eukprot:1998111-Pyramimonas_sp.AAC.1
MRPRHPFRHAVDTLRGPMGTSTHGPTGTVHMRPRHPCRRTPHTLRGPGGSSIHGPSGTVHMLRPPLPSLHDLPA